MEQSEWTESALIQLARDHGIADITARKLKRFRQEGVLPTPRTDHPGFGGTTSYYPAEAGLRVLAICRLLKQTSNYDAVRVELWLEGDLVETGLLKESLWRLVPFSSLDIPPTPSQRERVAKRLARRMVQEAWKAIRSNLVRKVLQQFKQPDDQQYFTSLLTQLLYGVPIDFTRTFRDDDPDLAGILEEPADVFAHGLHVQQVSFLPKDLARDLQRLSDEQLLSLTRLRTVLFAATQEDLELARTRRDIIGQIFEVANLIGYGGRLWHLMLRMVAKPWMRALLSIWLLVLEQSGYGPNIETINEAISTNLPLIRYAHQLRQALQQELPYVAKEMLP